MRKTGYVILPLHGGHAPKWLTDRMKALSKEVVRLIVDEQGQGVFLQRLSDPYWFQAFGCVLGFDWHSSGLTTVVTGILKDVLTVEDHGIRVAGGKGKASRKTPGEVQQVGEDLGLSTNRVESLKYASRMCAKIDTAAVQAGYPLYHHVIFVSERGDWCVVQQGLDVSDRTARRYHWLSQHVKSFVVEPHDAIVGDAVRSRVLDMTARDSEENKKVCVDLARGDPHNLQSSILRIASKSYTLDHWSTPVEAHPLPQGFAMPSRLNWRVFKELYDKQPRDYEELISYRGVGPASVRALALVVELVYGEPPSWRDPVKFTFAHGGKDGVPYPVNRGVMDESIRLMRESVESSRLGDRDRVNSLKRLERLAARWGL